MRVGASHKDPTRRWRYQNKTIVLFLMDSSMKSFLRLFPSKADTFPWNAGHLRREHRWSHTGSGSLARHGKERKSPFHGAFRSEIPCAPRTGGGQDARPAQKSETRLRHPMLGKHLIRPSGFRRQTETGWEAGLAFWKALCAAAGKRQVVRAERTRLLKGETGTGLCNITERE